ncbi:amidase domain-containing protein [Staphylococcus sp. IVB6246]|uniref:amidase domain-containing protein n=1 Tax=Staphylococcus sp. IVB6246 TaxID=2989772 RepID=UPI0021D22905|nr:amidase domain-containing protein [Staphylococcus sp. IVB6246]UXR69476.1 amidase domain-containing protein [Staphylococcus sp. IVB6246]
MMKRKVFYTALLSTALVASPTTSSFAEAASQKTQAALEQDLTKQSEDVLTEDPFDIVPEEETDDVTPKEKANPSKKERSEKNKDAIKTSTKEDQNDLHSSLMDPFDQWLYNTAIGISSTAGHDIAVPESPEETTQNTGVEVQDNTGQSEVTQTPSPNLSTDERDFFDNLNAILNEETPFDDLVSSEDFNSEDESADGLSQDTMDQGTQTHDDETSDEEETLDERQLDTTDETDDLDTTQDEQTEEQKVTPDNDSETSNTDDEDNGTNTPTDDTNAATQEGKTSMKDDIMIEALLDEYSDKSKKTQTEQQKSQSSKQTSNNPQIPPKETYTGGREQAPAQSFDDLPNHSKTRQTTWFQEYALSGNQASSPSDIRVAPNQSTRKFINDIAEDAHRIGQENDLYASIMIAQAILESDSGRSDLAQSPNYNLFGMKGAYHGEKVGFNTLESNGSHMYQIHADFRKYPNKKASLEDYAKLIKGGIDGNPNIYKGVWKSESSSYRTATSKLVGTYATDPNYDTKLKQLIQTYDLTRFDQKKMPKLLESQIVSDAKDASSKDFKTFHTTGSSPYPHGQCTWYVYHRMAQFGKSISGTMGNGGEWTNSAHANGYKVTNQPTKHSAVVFGPGQLGADSYYGHVAFVEDVRSDGSIVISESNVKGLGVISYRTIDATSAQSLDYIVR